MSGRAVFVLLLGIQVARGAGASMPQDAYVWQRAWNEPTLAAVLQHGTNFSEIAVLGAEVAWNRDQPRIIRVPVNYPALRLSSRAVGVVLRIGPFPGPFATNDLPAKTLASLAHSLVEEAASNQVHVVELQIDFDCAQSKLEGYGRWVEAIRRAVSPTPVVLTMLPAWLPEPAFPKLAALADGLVLQVHSLERPRSPDATFTLCDPEAARRAVSQLARFGRPFRVALPTYGYLIAFDSQGKFIGLSAEGPAASWPENVQTREVRAEPFAMADLVREWQNKRPEQMRGVIWYRLPVEGERLNWPWPTLTAVMAGRHPLPELHASVRQPQPGLLEIDLQNSGQSEYSGPLAVRLGWKQGRALGSDGLNGFDVTETRTNAVLFQRSAGAKALGPERFQTIGWVRLNESSETQVEIVGQR